MSERTCTRCGEPLVAGACPRGHPQRAARRERRRRKWPIVLVLLTLVLGVVAYGGLVWYPQRAAGEIMRPLSGSFSEAATAVDGAVEAFPQDPTAESLTAAGGVLAAADAARAVLAAGQLELEEHPADRLPFVSQRDPLRLANEARDRIERYYPEALQLVGDLEASARYLTQLAPVLPNLDNLSVALDGTLRRGGLAQIVASAQPIADQLLADVRTLSPPTELSTVQASLLAVARGIQGSVEELQRFEGTGGSPVLEALIQDVRAQLETFRQTASGATSDARASGLDERITAVRDLQDRIAQDLTALAGSGVDGITLPGDA